MGHTRTYEALVLRTYDIGEADRFCIILTRERGRLAARARGVRKLKSRMGGSLLPLSRVKIELHEGKGGFLITSAQSLRTATKQTVKMFVRAQEGIELLMQLLEDDTPIPEIFDLTEEFLEICAKDIPNITLSFTVRLLFLLGLLPHVPKEKILLEDREQIQQYIQTCTTQNWQHNTQIHEKSALIIQTACDDIIANHARSELRVAAIVASMAL